MSADRQPLLRLRSTTRSKKQKDRFFCLFRQENLMLAEHNRCGPALAAATATFPLNDVVYLLSRRSQLDLSGSKTLCFPDRTKPTRSHSTLDPQGERNGGASRDRTDDLMLAKQLLSQLSNSNNRFGIRARGNEAKLRKADRPPALVRGASVDGCRRRRLRHPA